MYNVHEGSPYGVVANVLDSDLVVSEFEFQSRYYIHFRTSALEKGMNLLLHPAMSWIISLPYFYNDDFGIKKPTKVDVPLNKETKPMYTIPKPERIK